MTKINLQTLTIKKAHQYLVSGDFSARDLARAYLDNINPDLNAYIEIFDDVLEQADIADKKIKDGTATLLTGIPIAIKNNILIKGKRTTAGSKILENYRAVYDATVIKKLKEAGAVFTGGTNMDEFAMGSSTENSAFGVTKNPYDLTRVPGGSSGGSAVVVAAQMALAALGTDTGGSIRQPASFCGVVGLKPTYGVVSRYGAIAMGSSLDQIGSFGKTTEDAQILFDYIKGEDKMDSTTIPDEIYKKTQKNVKEKITIGIPRHFLKEGLDEDVLANFEGSLEKLKGAGYEIREIELPNIKYALAVYYILMPAEASTNLARYDGMRYGYLRGGENLLEDYKRTKGSGFGKEVRRRIMLGTYILSAGYYDAYYNKAAALREIIKDDFKKVFENVDAIITPTAPTPAFKIGEKANAPLQMYLADIFTVSSNVVGVPAMSVPAGWTEKNGKKLPVGLQIMAPRMQEEILFRIGKDFEVPLLTI
ncbi:MAG: Asp-tRNA(Asn)/Glu-tRNA(Gln) amidotransferase subunit GatA [Candidatus Pacebacteria bacterium]|nr:Asp-tRNA(Asn)/Glu-tRNA(Gln) amidotransferase subunit GatA [Candidatus Paceibacterota bacterium]